MTRNQYQIKISLKNSEPKIWRRIIVNSDILLIDLHYIIQTTMGWDNYHGFQYKKNKEIYGIPSRDDWYTVHDIRKTKLGSLLQKEKQKLEYEYDFGDSWKHEIILEKILEYDQNEQIPRCIAGKMNCPPEDCGGIWGYDDLVRIMEGPQNKAYREMIDWIGEFDPEHFNMEEINIKLKNKF